MFENTFCRYTSPDCLVKHLFSPLHKKENKGKIVVFKITNAKIIAENQNIFFRIGSIGYEMLRTGHIQ